MVGRLKLLSANMLAQGLGSIIALVFTIIGARALSIEDYGELRTVMAILPLLMILALPGFDTLILKQASLKRPVPLRRILLIRMALGTVAGLGLLMVTLGLGTHVSPTLYFFLICTAVLLPFYEVTSSYRNALLGYKHPHRGTQLLLQARLLCLALFLLMVAGLYITKTSFLWVYPAWMLANIIPGFWNYARILIHRTRPRLRLRPQHGRLNLLAAATITGAGFIYTLAYSVDKLWIRHAFGAEQLALYALLIMIPQEAAKIFDTSLHLFYRQLFFGNPAHRRKLLILAALASPVLVLGYTAGFWLLSPYVFGAAYSYSPGLVLLSGLLIPGLALEALSIHLFFTRRGERFMLLYTACNLALTALLVPVGGAMGGLAGILAALAVKQFTLPLLLMLYLRTRHELYPQSAA